MKIIDYLNELFPEPYCELNFNSNFELLVSVILSAQCTDKRVNETTKVLYQKYNTPQQFANLDQKELENFIKPCGFYHNKAKNIISASKDIVEKFNGKVPSNVVELMSLAGVGKKTANVVYSVAFGGDAIAVDTHVLRVSNRLGLVNTKNPLRCEESLMKKFPKKLWTRLHYQMVLFGRYKCKAIKPLCEECKLQNVCKYYKNKEKICY